MSLSPRVVRKIIKPTVFILMLLPLAWVFYGWWLYIMGDLSLVTANPIEYTNRHLGDWAMRFLLVTLAVRPLSRIKSLVWLMQLRRMVGLFCFFYAFLHVSSYVVLDQFFDWPEILDDILKRQFITVGMITLTLLTPLAMTSTKAMIKRLGSLRWQKLHSLIYLASVLVIFHYWMMVKGNQLEPKIYAFIVAALLLSRLPQRVKKRSKLAQEKAGLQ